MKLETFREEFSKLDSDEKINIYNDFCLEHGDPDKRFEVFDDEFFKIFFTNPYEAARATFFGEIQSWLDEYIRFNGYGNLESFTDYGAEKEAEEYVDDIYEYPDVWSDHIENVDDEDEEEDE